MYTLTLTAVEFKAYITDSITPFHVDIIASPCRKLGASLANFSK